VADAASFLLEDKNNGIRYALPLGGVVFGPSQDVARMAPDKVIKVPAWENTSNYAELI
jgi:hypothetical protein